MPSSWDPGIEPASLMSPTLADRFLTTSATWEAPERYLAHNKHTINVRIYCRKWFSVQEA